MDFYLQNYFQTLNPRKPLRGDDFLRHSIHCFNFFILNLKKHVKICFQVNIRLTS